MTVCKVPHGASAGEHCSCRRASLTTTAARLVPIFVHAKACNSTAACNLVTSGKPTVEHASTAKDQAPQTAAPASFLGLPLEIRRLIYDRLLPPAHKVIHPQCEGRRGFKKYSTGRTQVRDLMCVNSTIRNDVASILYESRTFAIHVHPDIENGGIEFLNGPRLPLHYQCHTNDGRFGRFSVGGPFGFHRVKKLVISIHPPAKETRHTMMSIYFTLLAVCRLLENGETLPHVKGTRRIKIDFGTPMALLPNRWRAIATLCEEARWWHAKTQRPQATEIHGISDIEFVLRPLAMLRNCRSVDIELPRPLRQHAPTTDFVSALVRSMTRNNNTVSRIDSLEDQLERHRAAFETFVNNTTQDRSSPDEMEQD